MTDDVQKYLAELRHDVEVETLRERALLRAAEWCEAFKEDKLALLVEFELGTLPVADAPPVLVSILRAEIARAIISTRRAGRIAKSLGIGTESFQAALNALRAAVAGLPSELPKGRKWR